MSAWKKNEVEPPAAPAVPVPAPNVGRATPAPGSAAVVGSSITIDGNVVGEEDLLIEGKVAGTVTLRNHSLTVGSSGQMKAEVMAKSIVVEGEVEGDLLGQEEVTIRPSGKVRGNIRAPRVSLESGCRFKGSIDMERKEAPAARVPEPAAKETGGATARQDESKTKTDAAAAGRTEAAQHGAGELPLKPAGRS